MYDICDDSLKQHQLAPNPLLEIPLDVSNGHLTTPPTDLEEDGLATEQLEQIWSWNTPVPPTLETCMHEIIAEQATTHPNRPAVNSWDGTFTYEDVNSMSDQFAAHLVLTGVRLGSIVPLCFEKSRWTVVAVLGVMKAGGTFALMDPSQPEGRLSTIVEQTGATIIVTSKLQESLGRRIAPGAAHVTLSADSFSNYDTSSSLPSVPASTNLYIQFTSGSTGKPKGVVITHANYTSGAVPRADVVGYRAHSRVLDFASYAFDVCIDCMLCTLSVGGCLCIPSDADRVNDLSGAIRKMDVNMAHMTPSVARVLDPDIIPSLEVLGLGGEAISAGDAASWSQKAKVINAYGPSECTVGCSVNGDVGAERHKAHISIGKGVGGTLWIVDPTDYHRLMPVGAVGELLVEGPIVGPGYLNDPEKTSASFVSDPKWLLTGSPKREGRKGRLYKTGDLVRYDTDGTIIFVGRGDQQVKLRGQRIELAEIEYNMRDKLPPGTRVAAEVIRPGGPAGEPTLVAFLAERAGLVPDAESLLGSLSPQVLDSLAGMNKSLSEHLPIYMVPAAYIPLQTMPLLVSAKTDRKRLRELGHSLSRKDIAGFAAATVPRKEPSTAMEKKLAQIWNEVLGQDVEIGAHDNFFNLGGDSLRAMKLVAQARAHDVSLTVADIFANPVLSDMALIARPGASDINVNIPPFSLLGDVWSEDAARQDCATLCDLDPSKIEDIYPCTPLQEAYVAQRVVELADDTAARGLATAFEIASQGCAVLRTRIVQVPGHGQSLSDYLAQDRADPVQLGKPLIRYGVVIDEKSTGKAHFVLTMHHALYDGWSMPLVVERVNRAYNNLSTERPADFKHFIKYLGGMNHEESETYWRERLEGANGEQFPPLPYSGYQQQADSLLEHYVHTGKPTTGITIATIIRGAWSVMVSKYMATNDVVFGETLTGRNAPIPGVEQIEGPMIATIPVREYLQEIHDKSVVGIAHEHFEACELRTGLQPANGFMPAGDAEAAQEALKFNTYALMLVFDSKTVTTPQMERMLEQLGRVTQQLIENPGAKCSQIQLLSETDEHELARLSRVGVKGLDVTWITDPDDPERLLPPGAIGELLIRIGGECDMEAVPYPKWASHDTNDDHAITLVERASRIQTPSTTLRQKRVPATSAKQKSLRQTWSRIMAIDEDDIGLDDSFFQLGGDSIGAMKLVSELRAKGLELTVPEIFKHRTLQETAESREEPPTPFSLLDVPDVDAFIAETDIYPARPLQQIAVRGTTRLPRFSVRYELFHLSGRIDPARLLASCRALVARNEILRTVFVEDDEERCFGVVLEALDVALERYEVESGSDPSAFAHRLCDVDVQTRMPPGSAFVKFMLVEAADSRRSCLAFRISHAQYDEVCLPALIRQLAGLYDGAEQPDSAPFSSFVHRILRDGLPRSIPYWRDLLRGSAPPTVLGPGNVLAASRTKSGTAPPAAAVCRTLDVSARPRDVTPATLPTAAWALCVARRAGSRDVVFGEVVGGRAAGADDDRVAGPTWQYVPVRVRFDDDDDGCRRAADLLRLVQAQHVAGAQHGCAGLGEIVAGMADDDAWAAAGVDWFDSVVHQDVRHVETLSLGGVADCHLETVYPHPEPLREWKLQAFFDERCDRLTLEIVTFEDWVGVANELLDELERIVDTLVKRPDELLFG
ncbi:peptide synthetase [Hypoxylon sp. FL1284]|nr:peptide synthetase [Hypoxylon sp. FL1284]